MPLRKALVPVLASLLLASTTQPAAAIGKDGFAPPDPEPRTEYFVPVWEPTLRFDLFAGKLTQEVEECFCPEQLVIGFSIGKNLRFGAGRTKLPITVERDIVQRKRRWGALAMYVIPF